MQRPLLVTGAYGQLGRAMLAEAERRGVPAAGRDLDTLDVTDEAAVRQWIVDTHPRALINCAAYTSVDDCEAHEAEALAVNATAVRHLARACTGVGATLVQISTDYVFDGTGNRPYREDDPVAPAGAYGRTKLAGEHAARIAADVLILRTAWLYGRGGHHFVGAIRRQIDNGNPRLRVVSDQHGCPTFCDDLAAACLDLIDRQARGLFHAVNHGATTWHGFAVEIARRLGSEVEIEPVTTEAFPRPAPRPAYSVLDISKLETLLGRTMPTWQDALKRYLEDPCAP
ncbi:MAG: dTDP-4-dehydrorhamnose reductase [Thermoanaerobaculales bacterium]|jgi:dTDP-4-dehydrorhamnose reductase|nr:dTDP-4-dehydrorhamnose reductase [Thermoanaerobaculales bacterium]